MKTAVLQIHPEPVEGCGAANIANFITKKLLFSN